QREVRGPVSFRAAFLRARNGAGGFDLVFAELAANDKAAELMEKARAPKGRTRGECGKRQRQFITSQRVQLFQQWKRVRVFNFRWNCGDRGAAFVGKRLEAQ